MFAGRVLVRRAALDRVLQPIELGLGQRLYRQDLPDLRGALLASPMSGERRERELQRDVLEQPQPSLPLGRAEPLLLQLSEVAAHGERRLERLQMLRRRSERSGADDELERALRDVDRSIEAVGHLRLHAREEGFGGELALLLLRLVGDAAQDAIVLLGELLDDRVALGTLGTIGLRRPCPCRSRGRSRSARSSSHRGARRSCPRADPRGAVRARPGRRTWWSIDRAPSRGLWW